MQYMLMCLYRREGVDTIAGQREARDHAGVWGIDSEPRHERTVSWREAITLDFIRHDRTHEGRQTGTHGPFAETKEQLGGYHLVECRNLDEALSIAARIPTLPAGGAIEGAPPCTVHRERTLGERITVGLGDRLDADVPEYTSLSSHFYQLFPTR